MHSMLSNTILLYRSKAFGDAIVEHVGGIIKRLQDETGTIYKAIQGPYVKVPPIRIELASEGAADSRRAQLLVDFAGNKGMIPGGFLSDSQIHTLALALRFGGNSHIQHQSQNYSS